MDPPMHIWIHCLSSDVYKTMDSDSLGNGSNCSYPIPCTGDHGQIKFLYYIFIHACHSYYWWTFLNTIVCIILPFRIEYCIHLSLTHWLWKKSSKDNRNQRPRMSILKSIICGWVQYYVNLFEKVTLRIQFFVFCRR